MHQRKAVVQGLMPVEIIHDRYGPVANVQVGDIGNTAEAYARAYFDVQGHDAVTINPYMGDDAVRPFLRRGKRVIMPISRAWGEDVADAVRTWAEALALEHPPGMVTVLDVYMRRKEARDESA